MWKGILLQNAHMVSRMLEKMEEELAEMRKLLKDMDGVKLMEKLKQAKQIKDSLQQ